MLSEEIQIQLETLKIIKQLREELNIMSATISSLGSDFSTFQAAFTQYAADQATFVANTTKALQQLTSGGENISPVDQTTLNTVDTGLQAMLASTKQMDSVIQGITFPSAPVIAPSVTPASHNLVGSIPTTPVKE